ncbi:MAG: ATP-binding protein, partial [bacterium]
MPRKLLFCVLFLSAGIFTAAGYAQSHAIDGDFITEWLLLGPFKPNALDRDFLASVGGEANIHPKEGNVVITGQSDTLRWKRYRSPGSIIHFDHAVGPYEFVTVYAFCVLYSESQRKAQFLAGSNDEIAVWINGQQVYRHSVVRGVNVDDDVFTAELKAGENTCLVKITNGIFTWGFSMRAFPEGQPVAATPKMHLWAGRFQIKGNSFICDANWKYHPGDNPQWAAPEFDDRSWKTVRSVGPPHQWPDDWRGIGWFRLHLSVDSTLWNRPLAMNVWQWGASEIYLDGKLCAQYGKVGSSINDENSYAVLNPDLSLPKAIVFDQNTDHVFAVRYSNFFLMMKKSPNLWHGFQVNLRELNSAIAASAEQRETNMRLLVIMTSGPLVFAVLHLLLFLFYRRTTQNLYYAIMMLTIGMASFFNSQYEFSFVTDLRQAFLYKNLGQILLLFSGLAALRFLYAIFYPKLPKQFWLFLFLYIAVLIWIWDNPFHTEDYANLFAATALLEMLRIVVVAILRKKKGAWIIGTGISFMIVLFGASIILTGMGILPQTLLFQVTLPGIGITGLLLSMSVYLAWDFARTNKNLEAQIVQVKALSEKTLQQELEQVQLKHELEMEHLQAEKLQEIDRMKSRFFANISHEFRTPLTLILGPLEKLLSENFREPVKKQFRIMLRNGRRLLRLINQLLDLARLEAGSMSLKARPENIVQLLKGIVLSFFSLAERKQITLKFEAPEESIIAYVDRDKLEKIVSNLLSNAFKFTPEGGVVSVAVGSANVEGRREKGEGRRTNGDGRALPPSPIALRTTFVEISISDTGIGIPPDKLEKIFDRFYQADDSYTREQEGSGIGLALTKELVELHHGEIHVTSELGRGSTFIVCLPLGKEHLKSEEIVEEVISVPASVNLQVASEQDADSPSIQPSIDPSIQDQTSSIEHPVLL